MARPMVEIVGLAKRYGQTPVLRGVDLEVATGEVVALLGPNGAGKTTTVEILATLRTYDAGRVRVSGYDVATQASLVRGQIGLTGQYAAVDELLTGRENLRLMARLSHLRTSEARSRADELLEVFDLTGAADRLVRTYSGGMRRRLDLAAGLLARPGLVVLDEPTTGLDPRSRADLWQVIRELAGGGTTILLTTQYLEEADALADRVAVLDGGRVVADDTPAELKRLVGQAHVHLELADGGTHRIPTDASVTDVRRVLADVEAEGLAVASWRLAVPTLDDVFLTLTGRPAAEPQPHEEAAA